MKIEEASEKLYRQLKIHEEVVGAYTTHDHIVICLVDEKLINEIPTLFESYDVKTEITGEFHLQ